MTTTKYVGLNTHNVFNSGKYVGYVWVDKNQVCHGVNCLVFDDRDEQWNLHKTYSNVEDCAKDVAIVHDMSMGN